MLGTVALALAAFYTVACQTALSLMILIVEYRVRLVAKLLICIIQCKILWYWDFFWTSFNAVLTPGTWNSYTAVNDFRHFL